MIAVLVAQTTWRCTDTAGRNLTRLLLVLGQIARSADFRQAAVRRAEPRFGSKTDQKRCPHRARSVLVSGNALDGTARQFCATSSYRITQPLGTPRVLQTTAGLATGATTTGAATAGRATQPLGTPTVLQ